MGKEKEQKRIINGKFLQMGIQGIANMEAMIGIACKFISGNIRRLALAALSRGICVRAPNHCSVRQSTTTPSTPTTTTTTRQ
jgi:hypothetical protein